MKNILLGTVMAVTMGAASAESTPLAVALQELVNTEVVSNGYIGYSAWSEDKILFNGFEVTLDAGRIARKSLSKCKFGFIGEDSNCTADVKAEIEVDGNEIKLIVFELSNLKNNSK